MLRISYQHPDGHIHLVEVEVSTQEMLALTQGDLAQRYADAALAAIQERIREHTGQRVN